MFYVYVYKDPRPTKAKQVVYVGKGKGRRAWAHWEKAVLRNKGFGAFLALLRRNKQAPIIEIVQHFDDEADAFMEEIRLIALYGRRDTNTGTLFNLTDGGEGFGGVVHTEEWCRNISEALRRPEVAEKNSAAAIRRWEDPEYRERTTAAIRAALKEPDVIARREAGKAAFIHTDAFRETMSRATAKMWQDPAYVAKVVAAQVEAQNTEKSLASKSKHSKRMWQEQGETLGHKIKVARNTEASKEKTRNQAKAQWADPGYAAMQTANNREIAARPEVKQAKADAAKKLWADPEWKAKMLAARKTKKTLPAG